MKKYVLILGLLCTLAAGAGAQRVTPGIKGGLNIADISGFNGDNRLSGHFGLFINSRFNSRWAIQPELLYTGQGQQYRVGNDEFTLALSYIQVPIMFQFYPVKDFYLEFGPHLGFLLSANVKDDGDKTEVDEHYKKVDAGLSFGAGIRVTNMLGFYGRYNAGLADVTKNDNRDYFNRVGQLGVYILLK
ncbi:porin family protein [Longitalea luteola]|uniref:porin family protein n=1 Tax=Longitalea luteola TaxID=2812563 RepID=UPI001A959EEB|nr:porin family protein [Longitalea luteola]